jgi:hypothetical protein
VNEPYAFSLNRLSTWADESHKVGGIDSLIDEMDALALVVGSLLGDEDVLDVLARVDALPGERGQLLRFALGSAVGDARTVRRVAGDALANEAVEMDGLAFSENILEAYRRIVLYKRATSDYAAGISSREEWRAVAAEHLNVLTALYPDTQTAHALLLDFSAACWASQRTDGVIDGIYGLPWVMEARELINQSDLFLALDVLAAVMSKGPFLAFVEEQSASASNATAMGLLLSSLARFEPSAFQELLAEDQETLLEGLLAVLETDASCNSLRYALAERATNQKALAVGKRLLLSAPTTALHANDHGAFIASLNRYAMACVVADEVGAGKAAFAHLASRYPDTVVALDCWEHIVLLENNRIAAR